SGSRRPGAPLRAAWPPILSVASRSESPSLQDFFRVKKVNNRWMFVTPAGNAFWMLGVFAADVDTRFIDLEAKYGGRPTWGVQVTRRMKAWGFNTLAEYASAYVLPGKPNVEKLPFVVMIRPSFYGLRNYGGYAPAPFKDLVD